jgi:AAHS family benzoate transporter-like MFS transporter
MVNSTRRRGLTPVFVLCWLALLADGFDLYVYGATLPSMIGPEPLGITPQLAGTIGSVALIGMLLGSLSVGMLTDRLGRRRIFMVAVTVFSLACSVAPQRPTGNCSWRPASSRASEWAACCPRPWR